MSDKFTVVCQECGKKWKVVRYADICPRCGGADIDIAEYLPADKERAR